MSEGKEQSRKTGEFPVQQSYSEIPRRKIKMATVKELLRAENDGTLSFGDYTLPTKTKKDNFEFEGDIYKVKTFAEITKLEKNGMFVYESVPGSTVENFKETDAEVTDRWGVCRKDEYKFERKAQCKCRTFSRSECSDQSSKVLIC